LEGINATIGLFQRRGYGHRDLDNLITMIYLCLGSIAITRPQLGLCKWSSGAHADAEAVGTRS
jgi:hypothetical protein